MQLVICITAFKMCFSPFFPFNSLILNRVRQKDENVVFSCCDISLFKEQLSPNSF